MLPTQSILFGVHVSWLGGIEASSPTAPFLVELFDSETQTGTLLFKGWFGMRPPNEPVGPTSILFPAGLRIGKGLSMTLTGTNYTYAVTFDYS